MNKAILFATYFAATLPAQAWTEPPRGSADRGAMMDALRPHAEWIYGAPVEFVIQQLRVQGNVGFAVVGPQRPGGGAIDLATTPLVQRDGEEPTDMDGTRIDALYKRVGTTWVAVHWVHGATDVWYAWDAFCPDYAAVLPEFCN